MYILVRMSRSLKISRLAMVLSLVRGASSFVMFPQTR
ncbi:Uncharacterised protein [Vibrio cholerae]|nr:Uncharacterised protein [Vibrio cholerae]